MTENQVSACCHARAYTKTTDQGEMQVCFHCFSPFQLAIPGAIPTNQQGAKKFRARVRRERLGNIGCALVGITAIGAILYAVITVVGIVRAPDGETWSTCIQRVTQEWMNVELSDAEYNAKLASKCGVPNPILP